MMRKLLNLLVMGFLSVSIFAQSPQSFKYQSVVRDNTGNLINSQNVSFRISILQGSAGGISVYSETHALTTNEYGLANLNVGGGTPVSGNFSSIVWGSNTYFIKIEMDPLGGTAYQLMGTSQLLSVPYALYAQYSSNGVGSGSSGQTLRHDGIGWTGNSTLYNDGANIGIGTNAPAAKLDVVAPTFNAKLASSDHGVYGEHTLSGSYGYLGGSNVGGFGYSQNAYGILGSTADGNAIYGVATGTGFAGYFSGKTYITGNLGIGESTPNRKLYVSDLQTGLAYPLKIENKHTVANQAAAGILFSVGGSGTTERGKGGLVYEYTSTWNRGSFHFLQNAETNANNPTLANAVMTITNSGNVSIGTTNPQAKLEVAANAGPHIIINDLNSSNDRPGIKFTNNYIHYISGDDGSDETFGFYSGFGDNRTYDAILAVYGKATSNWGKYLGLSHNGTSGRIFTDAGDLLLQPAGGVAINSTSAGTYKLSVTGDVYVNGSVKTSSKTGAIIIPPAAFESRVWDSQFINYGSMLIPQEGYLYFYAPVYLPQNATVTDIISYWQDNSALNGTIELYRVELSSGSANPMTSNITNWQSTTRTGISDNTIDFAQIDNQNFMYILYILLHTEINFYGAKIEYTYDELN